MPGVTIIPAGGFTTSGVPILSLLIGLPSLSLTIGVTSFVSPFSIVVGGYVAVGLPVAFASYCAYKVFVLSY